MVTFKTILKQEAGMNATGIQVPAEAISALNSGKKPKVKITVNGYQYRSTVAAYKDAYMLPFASEHRAASGINAGDEIEVTLELDTEPRIVEVPEDLANALQEAGLREKFDSLAFTHRKEHVRALQDAKAAETRARRLAAIIAKLQEGKS